MMRREDAERLIYGAEESMAPVSFNFGALPVELSGLESSKFVLLPIPYDSTSSYRTGSRHAPTAIIEASRNLELYDPELDEIPARFGIHTYTEMEVDASGPEKMTERIAAVVGELLGMGKIVGGVGGEHSVTAGIVRAYAERHPDLSVLQLDAHADLRDAYQGTKYSHACTMRRVREVVGRVAQVGVRSYSAEEAAYIEREGVKIHPAAVWTGSKEQVAEVIDELGEGPLYVTCDLDVLDPSVMPATGTPEPGGFLWRDLIHILDEVSMRKRIVGFDVVELIPLPGVVAPDFLATKLIYKIVGLICRSGEL